MTPSHQRLVDTVLKRMAQRVNELLLQCHPIQKKPSPDPTLEQLRETVLGQHLAAIAHYSEGYPYPYEGDIRLSIDTVARCLFGTPLMTHGFRLPQKWQRDPLGKLVHTALLRFYEEERPGMLVTVAEVRTLFGVKRQTVHQWISDGVIFAVYRGDTPLFYQKEVTQLQQTRAKKS